jgi:release factor glutamine methyltransferase
VEETLAGAGCVVPGEEALELVGRAPDRDTLRAWTDRRCQGEPLEWIVGFGRFCGREIVVAGGVYVPRVQTEELATRAAWLLPPGGRAADLCGGTGAVADHLRASVARAEVVTTDVDARAAECARRNRVPAVVCDLGAALRPGAFDLVTAVPPYVPTPDLQFLPSDVQRWEPRSALDGGPDGLTVLRRVVTGAARLLKPGGWLVVEVGGEQDGGLGPDLAAAGFGPARSWHDGEGDLRGLAARLDRTPIPAFWPAPPGYPSEAQQRKESDRWEPKRV